MANETPGQQRQFAQPVMQSPFDIANITANGTTTPKTGPGMLHAVMINTKGATGNTLTLYDGTDVNGTKLATIDTTVQVGPLPYDIGFQVGLTAVLANGTAADVTLAFR